MGLPCRSSRGKNAVGLMVRRERVQLLETIERSRQIYGPVGARYSDQDKMWRWPNGARLRFAYLERDADADAYQGHSYTRVYVEELGTFPSASPVLRLMATLRSGEGVPSANGSASMAASPLKCFGYRPQASTVNFASAERKTPQNHELSEKKDAVRGPRSDGPSKDLTSSPGAKVSESARMVSYVIVVHRNMGAPLPKKGCGGGSLRGIFPLFRWLPQKAETWTLPSPANAALCALIASAFWTFLGYGVGRHLLPRSLALGASPVLGWAVHSAALLPIVVWTGFSPLIVGLIGVGCIALAAFSWSQPVPASRAEPMLTVPPWAFALAAILAVVPAVAILPKFSGDAVYVADPIFDHAKIAIVDAIDRLGLPPVSPVFSESGVPDRLPYYYLWHFSAAAAALTLGVSGWEADIGLTWFSAFASLALMMGLAVWLSQRSRAATWVVVLAAAGSLWSALDWAVRAGDLSPLVWPPVGMGGWLFQATWVPQHLMAASCSVTAMLLVTRYVQRQSWALLPTLVLVVVAAFRSSAFVGGIAFALAGIVAAPALFAATCPAERWRVAAGLAIAALLIACFITPFVFDQLTALRTRADGSPIVLAPYTVFGELFPKWLRRLADVPGYWLIILLVESPAAYFAGLVGLMVVPPSAFPPDRSAMVRLRQPVTSIEGPSRHRRDPLLAPSGEQV